MKKDKLPTGVRQRSKGSWQYTFRYLGKQYFFHRPIFEQILHLRNQIITDIGLKRFNPTIYRSAHTQDITFKEFATKWVENLLKRSDRKPSTKHDYKKRIKGKLIPFFGHFKLGAINKNYIDTYKRINSTWSPRHMCNNLGILSQMLKDAKEQGLILDIPQIEFPKKVNPNWDWLRPEEVENFLSNVESKYQLLIKLLLRLGLRVGEAVALTKQDIDFTIGLFGKIHINKNYFKGQIAAPKSATSIRWVPLNPEISNELKEHILKIEGDLLFPSNRKEGCPLDPHHLNRIVKRALDKAGIARNLGAHSLRHSCASHLALTGVPLAKIKCLLGHSSIRMTERYAHLAAGDIDTIHNNVDNLLASMSSNMSSPHSKNDKKDQTVGESDKNMVKANPSIRLVNS